MSRPTNEVTWWWGEWHAALVGPEEVLTSFSKEFRLGATSSPRNGLVELAWAHGDVTPTAGGLKSAVARAGGVLTDADRPATESPSV